MSDPRGPLRAVISVQRTPTANLTTLACGHVRPFNASMALSKPGDLRHCFECRTDPRKV